jgi:hypothetical protein
VLKIARETVAASAANRFIPLRFEATKHYGISVILITFVDNVCWTLRDVAEPRDEN